MTQFLPPNLLALFAPRDPIPFLPPADKLPFEKKRQAYTGVAGFLKEFEVKMPTGDSILPHNNSSSRRSANGTHFPGGYSSADDTSRLGFSSVSGSQEIN